MDNLALDLLATGIGIQVAVYYLVALAGGLVAALFFSSPKRLRRVDYFLASVALYLAFVLCQLVGLAATAAWKQGLLWVVVLFSLGASFASGALSYWLAIMRSNHARGHSRLAWLVFVPVVNFWLFFAGSKDVPPPRSRGRRYVFDPLLIALGVLIAAASGGVAVLSNELVAEQLGPGLVMELQSRRVTDIGLEAHLVEIARVTELPIKIDETTLVESMKASGTTLTLELTVSMDIDELSPGFSEKGVATACKAEVLVQLVRQGAAIEYRYYRKDDRKALGGYSVSAADCGF